MNDMFEAGYRHALYYLTVLQSLESKYSTEAADAAIVQFEREWPQVRQAREWPNVAGESGYALRLQFATQGREVRSLQQSRHETLTWLADALKELAATSETFEKKVAFIEAFGVTTSDDYRLRALGQIAHIYYELGDYDASLNAATQLLELVDRSDSLDTHSENALIALTGIAAACRALGQPQRAIDVLQRALSVARASHNDRALSASLSILGNAYRDLGRHAEAEIHLGEALAQATSQDDTEALVLIGQAIAIMHSRPSEALSNLERALATCQRRHDSIGEAATREALAEYQDTYGNADEALALLETAERLFREAGNQYRAARCSLNAARSLIKHGRDTSALQKFRQAVATFESSGDTRGTRQALQESGATLYALGRYEEAAGSLSEALRLARIEGDRSVLARTLGALGDVLMDLKRYDAAIPHLEEARTAARDLNDARFVCIATCSLGTAYRYLERFDEAVLALRNAEQQALQLDESSTLFKCLDGLGAICLLRDDFTGAIS
jgi:tetratricopeptide (TPR) repeat protein